MIWRARQHEFRFPRAAMVMGIVNVTPDSFYDGGKWAEAGAAVEHGLRLIEEGAEIIDVGGESTRPGAEQISVGEELRRVLPVIEGLVAAYGTAVAARPLPPLISIDTQKAEVAREAVAAGASIINNIAAAACDQEMWKVAAETGVGYVAMHMQGTPRTMQKDPRYADVVGEVHEFFARQFEQLTAAGVRGEQIVFDVGIGFGKTLEHNLELLAGVDRARLADRPMLLGVSRKSFMKSLLKLEAAERLAPALACTVWAAERGVEIFRTHDVAETVAALRMAEAIRSRREHLD